MVKQKHSKTNSTNYFHLNFVQSETSSVLMRILQAKYTYDEKIVLSLFTFYGF